jgi:hypothetical protein
VFVVATHHHSAKLPGELEHAHRVWTSSDQVANEDEAIVRANANVLQQTFQFGTATMYVAHDHGSGHRQPCLLRTPNGSNEPLP